jgi:hypothetical protein
MNIKNTALEEKATVIASIEYLTRIILLQNIIRLLDSDMSINGKEIDANSNKLPDWSPIIWGLIASS